MNLFTQNVIDAAWLVRESRSFLGEGELLEQFKETLSWSNWAESAASVEHVWLKPRAVLDRPSIDQLNSRYGSYRKLPADVSTLASLLVNPVVLESLIICHRKLACHVLVGTTYVTPC